MIQKYEIICNFSPMLSEKHTFFLFKKPYYCLPIISEFERFRHKTLSGLLTAVVFEWKKLQLGEYIKCLSVYPRLVLQKDMMYRHRVHAFMYYESCRRWKAMGKKNSRSMPSANKRWGKETQQHETIARVLSWGTVPV